MDPSFLPALCFEHIMSFLTGKEMLNIMTVSQNWYHAISSSSRLMSKVQIEIRGDWLICCELKQLTEMANTSDRAYSNALVSCSESLMPTIIDIFDHPMRNWKSVEFFDVHFESSDELKELFSCFESTVKNLKLFQVTVKGNVTLEFKNFKKLEKLKICYSDSIIYKRVLQSASNLKFLELGAVDCITETAIDAVKNLEHLKVLHMSREWTSKFMANEVTDIKFKLKEFSIQRGDEEINKENFIKFLKTQTDMKKLSLIEWFDFKILDTIFQMKLKELLMWDVPEDGWKLNFVSKSESIEILNITMVYVEPYENNVQEFLSRVPNVKYLKLRSINEELATFISSSMPKLQKIALIHKEISEDIRQILPQRIIYV